MKECTECGSKFEPSHHNSKICSDECKRLLEETIAENTIERTLRRFEESR